MKRNIKYRILEILPALVSYSALLLPILLAVFLPRAVAIFILIFSALWLVRAFEFAIYLIYAYFRFKKAEKTNWPLKLDNLNNEENLTDNEKSIINKLKETNQFISSGDILNLVIIPTYKEDLAVLRQTITSIKNSDFNLKKIYVCLATEERDHERGMKNAKILMEEFDGIFKDFFHFEHPDGISGEVKGKGGNITYSGRKVSEILKSRNEDFSKIIVTTLDADNCVHKDYFAKLTYIYCIAENRKNKSYQPLPFYFNNYWDVPLINKVVSMSSSFWHMIENGRPDRLRNFASHAQPLDALYDMDFWSVETIVEDGHQFWRSFLHFNGNYEVVPVFIPIYFDAFQGETYFRSLKGQFLQLRRWAWGVTDIPFMARNWWKMKKELPFFRTLYQFFRLCEGHFMWAVAPLLIAQSRFILYLTNSQFKDTIMASNLNHLIIQIFHFSLFGLIVAMAVTFLLVPRPKNMWQGFSIFFQWLLMPFTTVFFGSIASLTSQTILASGKKLEFNVTPKIRKETYDE